MRINDAMVLRAAKAMHAYYGIRSNPSERDLKMVTYMLIVAIQETWPKSEAEVDEALEYNHRNNP